MYNDPNAYLINHINIALSRKFLRTTIKFSIRILNLIKILYKLGCIKNYYIFKKKLTYIRFSIFFYKNQTFYKNIKQISTNSKNFNISLLALKKLNTLSKTPIFLVSTSKGILTNKEAVKSLVGGKLICVLG